MPSKAALGPLTRIAEKGPRTVPLRGPAMPKSHSQTSDPRQNGACATAAHPADSPKRAVELPIRQKLRSHLNWMRHFRSACVRIALQFAP
jgi:hypothetical protein